MGSISLNRLVAAIVTIALLATAATPTRPELVYPVTAAAEIVETSFATSNPIRTVVTVNSNRVDVLAADEKDVPKVLEKLRELCAGPFASLYPEICEHLGAGGAGEDIDLDGLDEIIWGPSKDPMPQAATPTNMAVDGAWSEPPSTRHLSTSLAEETGSIDEARDQSSSSVVSEPTPDDASTPLLVTLTVPAEIKTTKTYEAVVHEVPETRLSTTATVDDEQTSTAAKSKVPTTLETKVKSSSAGSMLSDAQSGTDQIVPITTTEKSEENIERVLTASSQGDSEIATTTRDINGKSEQDITAEAKPESETAQGISTTIASSESEEAIPIDASDRPESAKDESEKAIPSTDAQYGSETALECPWKTGDEGDDDSPGPCTVITIWHYGTITLPPGSTPTFLATLGSSNSEFRPVFTPTASPRPSRTRTSFDVTLPSPPSTDSPPLWFATPRIGCTQTVSLVPQINDPFTSTIYPETVTSTAFISCSCPNLATEYIVRHGIVIIPRTTISVLEPTTTKVVQCSASSSTLAPSG